MTVVARILQVAAEALLPIEVGRRAMSGFDEFDRMGPGRGILVTGRAIVREEAGAYFDCTRFAQERGDRLFVVATKDRPVARIGSSDLSLPLPGRRPSQRARVVAKPRIGNEIADPEQQGEQKHEKPPVR